MSGTDVPETEAASDDDVFLAHNELPPARVDSWALKTAGRTHAWVLIPED
jgi:hypothetical protein